MPKYNCEQSKYFTSTPLKTEMKNIFYTDELQIIINKIYAL